MISGSKNKGDWGEFYALVYLLSKRRLYAADEQLNRVANYFFPILKIVRDEKRSDKSVDRVDYVLSNDGGVDIFLNNNKVSSMNSTDFEVVAAGLAKDIPDGKGPQFTIDYAERFLNSIYLERLAAPPTEVTDIKMRVHDANTGRDQNMGFSIKSYLGGPPTLLNASEATNFVYLVKGISRDQLKSINSINTSNKIKDRIGEIYRLGGELEFSHLYNSTFSSNLIMIDSLMERVVSEMLLYHYRNNVKGCKEVIEQIESQNPLRYPREGMYIYKFKKFLCAKALGMDPSKEWAGMDEANGGYIAVKSDGEVLAYHLYNRDNFEQYLFDNTYFERGSTGKHNYAHIYEEDGRMYINLNLQIRFYGNH